MKVILDIKENNRVPFFMKMVKSLDYISIIKEVKDKKKSQFVSDWIKHLTMLNFMNK